MSLRNRVRRVGYNQWHASSLSDNGHFGGVHGGEVYRVRKRQLYKIVLIGNHGEAVDFDRPPQKWRVAKKALSKWVNS
jgi:hypothetical protein